MKSILATLAVMLAIPAADAAEFFLQDGSVIVGSIVRLVDGEDLVVDTEYMDEVTIEWDAITRIRGTQVVDVELFDGERLLGTVVFNEEGFSVVGQDASRQSRAITSNDVFSIEDVSDGFWDAIDVYTDLGMNIVRGNNQVTQLSFGAGIGYDTRNFETSLDGTTIINEQINADDTRRQTLSGNYTQKLRNNWRLTGLFQFEADEQQNLDGRTIFGGAFGRRFYNSRTQRFEAYTGIVMNSEEFAGSPREETPEGLLTAVYRLRSGWDLDLSASLFPNLEQSGRWRAQFDGALSFDLFADFDFKITVYDRYDSDPPPGNSTNDYGMTVGLSWEF